MGQKVTLVKAQRQLTARGIEVEDIAREAYSRFYIPYPPSTIGAFLFGDLKPGMLAYKVIRLTILEAFGLEINHGPD